jgi:hypothetical protein
VKTLPSFNSKVIWLGPRSQPYAAAVAAYWDGRFEDCLTALESHGTVAARALGARALLRVGRAPAALEAVDAALATGDDLDDRQHGELFAQRAAALARMGLGDGVDMASTLLQARVHAYAAGAPALEAELTHIEAHAALLAGSLDEAVLTARAVFAIPPLAPYLSEAKHFVPLQHSRARAHDLLAFAAARRENYRQQQEHCCAALAECDRSAQKDVVLEARLLTNLAVFAREFGDDGSVLARFKALPETPAIAPERYEIYRSLAWASALCGDHLGAFRHLRDAADMAPTTTTRIRATLDRAYLARELKQGLIALDELDYAERLAASVDWDHIPVNEDVLDTLAQLAEALALVSPARARSTFERYRALKTKLPAIRLASADRRAGAEALAVDAAISQAEGNSERAQQLYLEAFVIWDSLGYKVRAALVARALAALGAGERFSAYLRAAATQWPKSWLAL